MENPTFEIGSIHKLKFFNEDKYMYVAVLNLNKEGLVKVKCLKQPPYKLATSRSAHSLFDERPFTEEYINDILLNYENVTHTFIVHSNMLFGTSKEEKITLLKHLTYINFLDSMKVDYDTNLKIFNETLDELY